MAEIRLRARQLHLDDKIITPAFTVYVLSLAIVFLLPELYDGYVNIKSDIRLITDTAVGIGVIIFVFAFRLSLRLSICRCNLMSADGIKCSVNDMFYFLSPKRLTGSVKYAAAFFLSKAFIFVLCFLPGTVLAVIIYIGLPYSLSLSVFAVALICDAVLFAVGLMCYSGFSSSLFLCDYIFVRDEALPFGDIINYSQKKMKAYSKELRRLKFSFLGWFVLCVFFFPLIYVFPYYRQSLALFADDILKNKV